MSEKSLSEVSERKLMEQLKNLVIDCIFLRNQSPSSQILPDVAS